VDDIRRDDPTIMLGPAVIEPEPDWKRLNDRVQKCNRLTVLKKGK